MDNFNFIHPIHPILDGSNYVPWVQAMSSFLKGKKLWRLNTGDIVEPVHADDEEKSKFAERLEEWDSKNHLIITAFRKSFVPSINLQFGRFQTAKKLWDFLESRYTTSDLAHQYQLFSSLHYLKQEPGESIQNFVSRMESIWDQLNNDAESFTFYRDNQRVVQFLMALTTDFEPVRTSLLHRSPLPTMDSAVTELISEETRLDSLKPQRIDAVLATHSFRSNQQGFKNFQSMSNSKFVVIVTHKPIIEQSSATEEVENRMDMLQGYQVGFESKTALTEETNLTGSISNQIAGTAAHMDLMMSHERWDCLGKFSLEFGGGGGGDFLESWIDSPFQWNAFNNSEEDFL